MKCFRVQLLLLASVVCITLALGMTSRTPSRVIAEVEVGVSGAAATRNAQLRTELNWVFGGKPQRGWYLYVGLINRLLNTTHDPASDGFATDLERWQKKSGLAPTGVLDDASLYKMIAGWQGQRIKDRTPAQPQQLLTAPRSDFYDPERVDELRQVERETYAAYKRLVAAAISDKTLGLRHVDNKELAPAEKYLKIISSFRSREYQEKLRRESPSAGSAGLAVNSPHFTGRALDLYVGGEPVETNDPNRSIQVNTPVYKWLVRNAGRFGFQPYFYEPWHWEYVGGK
ncbi:MAG TPA: D-alanyl-D-alanine carboxypeptidase family protein [Pyrinomonadaceae bacterium]|nr:D-alanyl-D-alanine carboxypeptidase family protein [Pyrinomonadaceae bacterium]